jgi:hypothetical protein
VAFLLGVSLSETNCATRIKAAKAVLRNSNKGRLCHPFQVLYGPRPCVIPRSILILSVTEVTPDAKPESTHVKLKNIPRNIHGGVLSEIDYNFLLRERWDLGWTDTMSGKLSGLWKRLAKVEQRMADQARRAELANCNCEHVVTLAIPGQPEEFEAEMNLPCPAHGFRRLGRIMRIVFVDPTDGELPSPKLDELIATYEARLAQADREQAHDPQES